MSVRQDDRGLLRWAPWERHEWLLHGFSTRDAEPRAWAREPGVRELIELHQTHSATVLDAAEIPRIEDPEGDALVGGRAGIVLAIRTADCLPVLLVDPVRRVVAAAHAGWRGMAAGIVRNTVAEMERRYASRPQDLEALLGPAIRVENYEVGEEVAAAFNADAVVRRSDWPRPHLDLPRAAKAQLALAGLSKERVFDTDLCTYANPELFPSYRRDGGKCGRLVAVIGALAPAAAG